MNVHILVRQEGRCRGTCQGSGVLYDWGSNKGDVVDVQILKHIVKRVPLPMGEGLLDAGSTGGFCLCAV